LDSGSGDATARIAAPILRSDVRKGLQAFTLSGNVKKNVVPVPISLSSQIRPPWRSTHALCDEEAQTRPAIPLRLDRLIRLEDIVEPFTRDSRTCIADRDQRLTIPSFASDHDGVTRLRELDGIPNQVSEHLQKSGAIAKHRDVAVRHVRLETDTFDTRHRLVTLATLVENGSEMEDLCFDRETAGLN
jgi:hypothetical protein